MMMMNDENETYPINLKNTTNHHHFTAKNITSSTSRMDVNSDDDDNDDDDDDIDTSSLSISTIVQSILAFYPQISSTSSSTSSNMNNVSRTNHNNDINNLELYNALVPLERYLYQKQQALEEDNNNNNNNSNNKSNNVSKSQSIRDLFHISSSLLVNTSDSSSLSSINWNHLLTILMYGMEQREDHQQQYHNDDNDDSMDIDEEEDDDVPKTTMNPSSSNDESMMIITTKLSIISTIIYLYLISYRGSYAIGYVSINTIHSMTNVLQQVWKTLIFNAMNNLSNNSKKKKMNKTTINMNDTDDDEDYDDDMNDTNHTLSLQILMNYGIQFLKVLCIISQNNNIEYNTIWNIDIIEQIIYNIINVSITLISVLHLSTTSSSKESSSNNSFTTSSITSSTVQSMVKDALIRTILFMPENDDNDNVDEMTQQKDNDNDDVENDDENKYNDENDNNHRNSNHHTRRRIIHLNLMKRHDITVLILRCLYPILIMEKNTMTSTVSTDTSIVVTSRFISYVLKDMIQEITNNKLLYPYQWLNINDNTTNATNSTIVSTTPSKNKTNHDTTTPTPTPSNMKQRQGSHHRQSLTPKLKSCMKTATKTPSNNTKNVNSTTGTPKAVHTPITDTNTMKKKYESPGPVFSSLIGILQQIVLLNGVDRNIVLRKYILETIYICLYVLPIQEQIYYIQFIIQLISSKILLHRYMACEIINILLCNNNDSNNNQNNNSNRNDYWTLWNNHCLDKNESMNVLNDIISTLLLSLKGRIIDRIPTIRCSAIHAIRNLYNRCSIPLLIDEVNETNSHVVIPSSASCCFDIFFSENHILDVIDLLHDRILSDDKATVRKVSCTALIDLLTIRVMMLVHNTNTDDDTDPITENDISVLNMTCQDPSLIVRRAAAEGLTCLIETMTNTSSKTRPMSKTLNIILLNLEKAWITSTIPMVLDVETSCVNKAIELVERVLILPLLETSNETNSNLTAWRILANIGDGANSNSGSQRSISEALCVAVQKCLIEKINHSSYTTESIFRIIQAVAINTLNGNNGNNVFDGSIIENQRTGVWCLFNAVIGTKHIIPIEIVRSLKKSKIDITFLCTVWDKLLNLFLSNDTPANKKSSLQYSIRCCLHILSQLAKFVVDIKIAESTAMKLQNLIVNFTLPPEIIGSAITAMVATILASHKDESQSEQYKYCIDALRSIYSKCEESLSSFDWNANTTSRISRTLLTIGEVSMVGFSTNDDDHQGKVKTKSTIDENITSTVLARGLNERPSRQLIEYVQAFMTNTLPIELSDDTKSIPVSIRAHAFVTFGKLCLRDVQLAKQSLNILARELHDSIDADNWAVQSNSLLVLGDLCVKYTNMVDRFLPVMASCLQAGMSSNNPTTLMDRINQSPNHGPSLVRKHAILLLSNLILQDYVKWRGLLLHRFLVAAVDDDEEVRVLAEMILCGPLLNKQPRLFVNQFVESIFVLNHCYDHPIFKAAAAMGDGGSGITVTFDGVRLDGEIGRIKRMHIYQIMLSKMSDEDKIGITARIGKEILGGALKNGSELNIIATTTGNAYEAAYNVLSDALAILRCPQIKVGKSNRNDDDNDDDIDIIDPNVGPSNNSIMKRAVVAKGRLLSNISRKHLIEILIPILCQLKVILEQSRSILLNDVMMYMVDVYQRHKVEVQECLANDPTTLQEIIYDTQQYKNKLQQERKRRRTTATLNTTTATPS